MKILAFADIHGSLAGTETMLSVCRREKPDKVVICGDLFGGWNSFSDQIVSLLGKTDFTLYLVKGNNDRPYEAELLPYGMEDYALMYHFGRKLFFTHGHVYDKYRVPPILEEGDVLTYGHTHMNLLQKFNGLYVVNVGSVSRPRDGLASYALFDEQGVCLKELNGKTISYLPWN